MSIYRGVLRVHIWRPRGNGHYFACVILTALSLNKIVVFWLTFHCKFFPAIQWAKSQHWRRYSGLPPNMWQAIIFIDGGLVHWNIQPQWVEHLWLTLIFLSFYGSLVSWHVTSNEFWIITIWVNGGDVAWNNWRTKIQSFDAGGWVYSKRTAGCEWSIGIKRV